MIIHSIVPHELIFPVNEEDFSSQKQCLWNGIPLIVQQEGDQYKVVRIMSSNLGDFLRSEIQPGSYVTIDRM
ncbi:YlzJ-like family protein [Siminovitchia sp. 179-K 8D1 HS]|uniref:YlzJ-like family protein n=1 Tax=Siminovitchia sp. 179-K 8D1 HS TaxID=3142385 RepID=UPI0039A277FF